MQVDAAVRQMQRELDRTFALAANARKYNEPNLLEGHGAWNMEHGGWSMEHGTLSMELPRKHAHAHAHAHVCMHTCTRMHKHFMHTSIRAHAHT